MIEAVHLTKRYGTTTAVDDLSFKIEPGQVTGFLGPNGAGKTTTMRMIIGLDRPASGSVTIDGRAYRDLPAPLREVGALLDAKALHGGRSAYNHLRVLALSNGLPLSRVDEVLKMVGLQDVARRRAGGYSLGMSQRLGVAGALLGDPGILMFDEPVNGLDPEGILWIRQLMRSLAAEGRTVLVSSHLMSEMALTADHLLVIGRGKLIADTGVQEFVGLSSAGTVVVRSRDDSLLAARLAEQGARTEPAVGGGLSVSGVSSSRVGEVAFKAGIILDELTPQRASLEHAFMELTKDSVDFVASAPELASVGTDYPAREGSR
ncbi:MAG: ABC transporter ATP-binding protein [Acidimicrobiales bacterium]